MLVRHPLVILRINSGVERKLAVLFSYLVTQSDVRHLPSHLRLGRYSPLVAGFDRGDLRYLVSLEHRTALANVDTVSSGTRPIGPWFLSSGVWSSRWLGYLSEWA